MIEGLKVTVSGAELKILCAKRAEHHRERAKVYSEQYDALLQNGIEGMSYSGGDPKRALADKREQHHDDAAEMSFIAEHLIADENYLLDSPALSRLGISRRGY